MIVNPVLYQQGVKLPELTNPGTAADLLAGKQLVDQYGNPLTGTMPTATHPKPTLSRSGGTITAQHVQSAGYTDGGTTAETLTIPTKAGTTITPGTSRKTAVSSGYLTTGAVYVAGDTNLKAENIKSGVSIFGVAGSAKLLSVCTFSVKNNLSEMICVSFARILGLNVYNGMKDIDAGSTGVIEGAICGIAIIHSSYTQYRSILSSNDTYITCCEDKYLCSVLRIEENAPAGILITVNKRN